MRLCDEWLRDQVLRLSRAANQNSDVARSGTLETTLGIDSGEFTVGVGTGVTTKPYQGQRVT